MKLCFMNPSQFKPSIKARVDRTYQNPGRNSQPWNGKARLSFKSLIIFSCSQSEKGKEFSLTQQRLVLSTSV